MWAYGIYALMKAEFGNQQILNQTVQFGLIVCYFVLDYIIIQFGPCMSYLTVFSVNQRKAY